MTDELLGPLGHNLLPILQVKARVKVRVRIRIRVGLRVRVKALQHLHLGWVLVHDRVRDDPRAVPARRLHLPPAAEAVLVSSEEGGLYSS